ncbi:MAG TPA: VOC family protein [Pararhizobium sp.]|nr:VOC family protein [Pararhizobium sp.]
MIADPEKFIAAPLVPELLVSNLSRSLEFWIGILGFRLVYERPEEGFAYLDLDGAQLMLEERNEHARQWVTASLEQPYGRGINFQVSVDDIERHASRLKANGREAYMPIEEKWYRAGDHEMGVRQILVRDPDGYLIRLSQRIGERTLAIHREAAP